jgi:SAM-dependent methyltransferase
MNDLQVERPQIVPHDRLGIIERIIRERAPKSILELGAGDHSFDYVMPKGSTYSWVKVDMAPPCDLVCDFNNPELRLPLAGDSFDLAICGEVLEHLLWPDSLLIEIQRALRVGGAVLVSVPNAVSLTYRIAWMIGHIPSCAAAGNLRYQSGTSYKTEKGYRVGGHVVDFSRSRLESLMETSGFSVVRTQGTGLYWNRQIAPHWAVPASLASNLVCLAEKLPDSLPRLS